MARLTANCAIICYFFARLWLGTIALKLLGWEAGLRSKGTQGKRFLVLTSQMWVCISSCTPFLHWNGNAAKWDVIWNYPLGINKGMNWNDFISPLTNQPPTCEVSWGDGTFKRGWQIELGLQGYPTKYWKQTVTKSHGSTPNRWHFLWSGKCLPYTTAWNVQQYS